MQIPYVKYLKTKNQDTLIVYFERNALFFKVGTNSGWSHSQMIADEVNPSFALSYYNGEVFLLYSTRLGELYIVKTADFIQWDRKQISIEKKDLSQTKFFMTIDQSALHLFYHLPTETAGVHALIYTVFRNGKWEKPCQIDRFLPFGQTPFLTGKRNPRHIMLYYRTAINIVTVREMLLSPSTIGSMYPVIQTPYPCTDLSIIQDEERIHMLYIVRSFFRSQVIYQYKQSTSISAPRVLWEGGSCEQCLIFKKNHKLEAMWTATGQPYCCQSVDNGNSFSPIERYTALFPYHCVKGEFLTEDKAILNELDVELQDLMNDLNNGVMTEEEFQASFKYVTEFYTGAGTVTTDGFDYNNYSLTSGAGLLSEQYWPMFSVTYANSEMVTSQNMNDIKALSEGTKDSEAVINGSKYLGAIINHESLNCLAEDEKTLTKTQ